MIPLSQPHTLTPSQVRDSQGLMGELEKQVQDKDQDILHLQHLLDCCRGDLNGARSQLSASEDVSAVSHVMIM